MMFYDNVINFKLNYGIRIVPDSLVCGRFTSAQSQSVAAISHTLDKVVILDMDAAVTAKTKLSNQPSDVVASVDLVGVDSIGESSPSTFDSITDNDQLIVYVAIRDVIKSIGAITSRDKQKQDLLLIGCPCSVIIYDVHDQIHLLSIRTSSSIDCILVPSRSIDRDNNVFTLTNTPSSNLAICTGPQKLYTIRLGGEADNDNDDDDDDESWEDSELTSERSTSGTIITCLTRVNLSKKSGDFLLTGSRNETGNGGTISLFKLNLSDQNNNVQACKLRIDESAPITCLCAIPTLATSSSIPEAGGASMTASLARAEEHPSSSSLTLPKRLSDTTSTQQQTTAHEATSNCNSLECQYFAYGLKNGLLGVYRLIEQVVEGESRAGGTNETIGHERLWRHKCKCTPTSIRLFDMNGDGYDELVIAFSSGRLELRSPFTGQLLGANRLAVGNSSSSSSSSSAAAASSQANQLRQMDSSGSSSTSLVQLGLVQAQVMGSLWLLAATGRGTIIGFKPSASKAHQALKADWCSNSNRHHRSSFPIDEMNSSQIMLANTLSGGNKTIGYEQQHTQSDKMPDLHTLVGGRIVESPSTNGVSATGVVEPMASGSIGSSNGSSSSSSSGSGKSSHSIEVKQSHDLLQKINSLYVQQIELEQRLQRALVSPLNFEHPFSSRASTTKHLSSTAAAATTCLSASASASASATASAAAAAEVNDGVSIRHSWDLDLAKLELNLTIVVVVIAATAAATPEVAATSVNPSNSLPNATSSMIGGNSQMEAFKLLQVEEEKRILIESGRRLLPIEPTIPPPPPPQPTATTTATTKQVNVHFSSNVGSSSPTSRDATFVSRLNFSVAKQNPQFDSTTLKVKLFYCHNNSNNKQQQSSLAVTLPPPPPPLSSSSFAGSDNYDDLRQVAAFRQGKGRVCQKHIDVPRFAMFTFAPVDYLDRNSERHTISLVATATAAAAAAAAKQNHLIRLCYRLDDRSKFEQIFDWLEENFLCLQAAADHSNQLGGSPGESHVEDQQAEIEQQQQQQQQQQHFGLHISDIRSYIKKRSCFIMNDHSPASFDLKLLDAKQTFLKRNNNKRLGHESDVNPYRGPPPHPETRISSSSSGGSGGGGGSDGVQCKLTFANEQLKEEEECSLLRITLYRSDGLVLSSSASASATASGSTTSMTTTTKTTMSSNFEPMTTTTTTTMMANRLELECESADLAVHLVQSLVIDRLRLDPISSSPSLSSIPKLAAALSSSASSTSSAMFVDNLVACCRLHLTSSSSSSSCSSLSSTTATELADRQVNVRPILQELLEAYKQLNEQEESESRILTELYESADYAKNLLQQLSIAIELNEFSTSRELLGELFMMLDGTQNAARGHSLNNRSRQELSKKFHQVKEKLSLIITGHT